MHTAPSVSVAHDMLGILYGNAKPSRQLIFFSVVRNAIVLARDEMISHIALILIHNNEYDSISPLSRCQCVLNN